MSGTPHFDPASRHSGIGFQPHKAAARTKPSRVSAAPLDQTGPSLLPAWLAALALLASAGLTRWWPDADEWPYTGHLLVLKLVLAVTALAIGVAARRSLLARQPDASRPRSERWLTAMPWF